MGNSYTDLEIENAVIERAWIGYEDHGIMTSYVMLKYGGSGQGFGGWFLKGESMYIWVKGILDAVGVEHWEDLKGKSIRAEHNRSKVTRIGNFLEDKWFDPTESFEALQKSKEAV